MEANELGKSLEQENLSSTNASETVNESNTSETTSSAPISAMDLTDDQENHPETVIENSLNEVDDDGHEPLPKQEILDYDSLSKFELIAQLKKLIQKYHVVAIKDEVEAIKQHFYKKRDEELEILRTAHKESEESEEQFSPAPDPLEAELRDLYKLYRDRKFQYGQKLEHIKEDNLLAKRQIIDELKEIVHSQEINNDKFNEFKVLQQKWREIGAVPSAKAKDLWDTYQHYIDQFYDLAKITKELKELDFKKNLEVKLRIIEKTEALLKDTPILKAQKMMQQLHNEWKEAGPVPLENKDEIWQKFKQVGDEIYQKYHAYFDSIKEQLNANLEGKQVLCEKVEAISATLPTSPKEWDSKTEELLECQKAWKTFGFAPKSENAQIYERFRTLCDGFYDKKRQFYAQYKEAQHENLAKKTELCEKAEALKNSTDWKNTSDQLVKLQQEWKTIGPTPKKQSDLLWNRFRAACDVFFEEKAKIKKESGSEQAKNLEAKKALIAAATAYELAPSKDENIEAVRAFRTQWLQIGHVPFKEKDKVSQEFNDALNAILKTSANANREKNMENFKSKLSNIKQGENKGGGNKLMFERNQILSKLKALENEIATLENNIGFFSKSKSSSGLIAEINNKIDAGKRNIALLNEKLDEIEKLL